MNPRIIIVISGMYPFNPRGDFLAREIDAITAAFDRVLVLPLTSGELKSIEAPARIELIDTPTKVYRTGIGKVLCVFLGVLALPFVYPRLRQARGLGVKVRRKSSLKQTVHAIGVLGFDVIAAWCLRRAIPAGSRALAFYYWLGPVGFLSTLTMLGCRRVGRTAGRGHGEDLFAEERKNNQALTRYAFLSMLDDVWTAHDFGGRYLVDQVGIPQERVKTYRLGVPDIGRVAEPPEATDEIVVASCSHILPLKRTPFVGHVCELLAKRPGVKRVRWTHFGGGEGMAAMEQEFANHDPKLVLDWRGHVPAKELVAAMADARPHIFIHMSLLEGLPVSVLEALSIGVPCVATAAGGTSEMIDSTVGRLVSLDDDVPTVEQDAFDLWQETIGEGASELRARCRQRFIERVSNDVVVPQLVQALVDAWEKGQEGDCRRKESPEGHK